MRNDEKIFNELFDAQVAPIETSNDKDGTGTNKDIDFDLPHVNKKFSITVISIFSALIILPSIVWGALKIANIFDPTIMETLNFDTGENRVLAEFPDTFDAKTITKDIENWYNDNLPFRSVLYKTQNDFENKLEKPYRDTIQPALIKLFYGDPDDENSDTTDQLGDISIIPQETTPEFTRPPRDETVPEYDNDDELYANCNHSLATTSTIIKEATCSEWGVIGYACSKCDYVQKEYTQKLDHDYVSNIKKLPECGTNYNEIFTCSKCSDSYTQPMTKRHVAKQVIETVKPSYSDYGYTLVECADCGTHYRTELYDKKYSTTTLPLTLKNGVIPGKSGWLFQNAVMPYYQGTNLLSTSQMKQYATTFKELKKVCDEKGIELLIAIWPNKEMVYSEYMATVDVKETRRVPKLVNYIDRTTDVNIIYPLEELKAAKPYWELYLPLDTHWNRAGGLVGYQAMMKALGLETTDPTTIPYIQVTGGGNDLLRSSGFDASEFDPQKNYNFLYRPNVQVLLTPTSDQHNAVSYPTYSRSRNATYDKNVVLIGDSYRIMHCSYAERDFTDYSTGHKIYLERGKPEDIAFHEKIKEADILILTSVERLDYELLTAANSIMKILSE